MSKLDALYEPDAVEIGLMLYPSRRCPRGGLRMTPGRVPENVTLCGRVIHDGGFLSETTDTPPWPLCAACARVMEKET